MVKNHKTKWLCKHDFLFQRLRLCPWPINTFTNLGSCFHRFSPVCHSSYTKSAIQYPDILILNPKNSTPHPPGFVFSDEIHVCSPHIPFSPYIYSTINSLVRDCILPVPSFLLLGIEVTPASAEEILPLCAVEVLCLQPCRSRGRLVQNPSLDLAYS